MHALKVYPGSILSGVILSWGPPFSSVGAVVGVVVPHPVKDTANKTLNNTTHIILKLLFMIFSSFFYFCEPAMNN
jgi:hypothetical protein